MNTEEFTKSIKAYRETPSFQNDLFEHNRLWYQYRGFNGFWSILKSDSFRATDARFSNDSEEQRFGTKIMQHLLSGGGDGKDPEFNEDYIVCFCAEDDKLSQWRGYAPKGGVSIGYDLGAAVPFYMPLADVEEDDKTGSKGYRDYFVYAGRVCYLPPNSGKVNSKEYYQKCADMISYPLDLNRGDTEETARVLRQCAPFIKHAGFQEEDELRLVFRNEDGALSPCVRYRDMDGNGVRSPYIIVRPGDPKSNSRKCVVRLCLNSGAERSDALRSQLEGISAPPKIADCHLTAVRGDMDDNFCFGCTRRKISSVTVDKLCRYMLPDGAEFEWGIPAYEHSVIISQGSDQETLFDKVYPLVKKFDPTISVWCEGHLPIRSITVGPCIRQREVAESIAHYCQHIYWLRDVTIKTSNIPFRRST